MSAPGGQHCLGPWSASSEHQRGSFGERGAQNVVQFGSLSSRTLVGHLRNRLGIELIQDRETAADENTTAYFPLLDRIAEGHFDHASTDRDLYNLFKKTLQEEGHLAKPEDISSFEYALSIHAAAPRIEAHYQFYNTTVEPTLKSHLDLNCETWLHFNGQQYCDADFYSSSGNSADQQYVLEPSAYLSEC